MPRQPVKPALLLTERALRDLANIERFSVEHWGRRAATRYLSDIEAAMQRIRRQPELLRTEEDFHTALRFYSVNKHVLVCDVLPDAIFVLTILHSSMDIPIRLNELSPTLALETELLHRKLEQSKRRRR
jgi:toxin ParE1/3/4